MKWMFGLSTCCVMIFLLSVGTACTRSQPTGQSEEVNSAQPSSAETTSGKTTNPKDKSPEKPLFSKELKESLHFASSLERESLRLIAKNNSFEPTTLFSVLSYAFEVASGTKKSPPRNIDCSRFQIEKGQPGELKILKVCQKPHVLVAIVQSRLEETEIEVTFKAKEWASVVGLSVTLTNPDISCQLRLKEKKLNTMSCEHWAYFLSASDASATQIHLKTMSFRRDQELQLKLSGGFFHDLIERKKIEISVPLEGKIKLIEKEIEVKDDFADKVQTSEDVRNEKENQEKINAKGQENSEKTSEKESRKEPEPSQEGSTENQDEYQKRIQGQEQIPQTNPEQQDPEAPVAPSEIIEGDSSGGVPQQPPAKNRGR